MQDTLCRSHSGTKSLCSQSPDQDPEPLNKIEVGRILESKTMTLKTHKQLSCNGQSYQLFETILAPREMSEKVLGAAFGRTGLAISPLIKNRTVVPRKALAIKKLERRRDISANCRSDTSFQETRPKPSFAFRSSSSLRVLAAFVPLSTQWPWASLHGQGLSLHCLPWWLQQSIWSRTTWLWNYNCMSVQNIPWFFLRHLYTVA